MGFRLPKDPSRQVCSAKTNIEECLIQSLCSPGCPKFETCEDAKFKCCPDGITPAKGDNSEGCQSDACKSSLYGCCPDGSTPAEGNDGEGCPVPTTPAPVTSSPEDGFLAVSCKGSEY